VIKKIKEEQVEKLNLEGTEQDSGFKVYRFERSNLKIWKNYEGDNVKELQQTFLDFQNRLIEGWTEPNLVAELQLLEGFPLDSKVEPVPGFTQNRVLCVTASHIEHRLFICLDPKIEISTVQEIRLLEEEDIFICQDAALGDREKIMLDDGCNVKTI